MGSCYSCASHKALASPLSKQPRNRLTRLSRKGSHYSSITKSENEHHQIHVKRHYNTPASAENVMPISGTQTPEDREEMCVVPSDSGVESLGCSQEDHVVLHESDYSKSFTLCHLCHHQLKRLTWSSCHQCDKFRIDPNELSVLVSDTYCTCGPRQHGKPSACKTHSHKSRAGFEASHLKNSDSLTSDMSLVKTPGKRNRQHARQSSKSAQGVFSSDCSHENQSGVFFDGLCHVSPSASETVGDKPMNSVENEKQCHDASPGGSMTLCSEILREVGCICKCDIPPESSRNVQTWTKSKRNSSGSRQYEGEAHSVACTLCKLVSSSRSSFPAVLVDETEDHSSTTRVEGDDGSGHEIFKANFHPGSMSELQVDSGNLIVEEAAISSSHSPSLGCAVSGVLEDLILDREDLECPVSVMVNGQQMVLLNVATYSQLLDEVAMMKEHLNLLTKVIQEEDATGSADLSL